MKNGNRRFQEDEGDYTDYFPHAGNCNAVYNSWFVCNAPAVINCIFVFHEVKKNLCNPLHPLEIRDPPTLSILNS